MQWQDVLADKSLQDMPYKIELNKKYLQLRLFTACCKDN